VEHDRIGDERGPIPKLELQALGPGVVLDLCLCLGRELIENGDYVAKRDDVPVRKVTLSRKALAVHSREVATVQIFEANRRPDLNPSMPARDGRRVDKDVGRFGSTDGDFPCNREGPRPRKAAVPHDEAVALTKLSGRVAQGNGRFAMQSLPLVRHKR
jgi:hypothetical protein